MQFPVARMAGFGVACVVGANAQADILAYDTYANTGLIGFEIINGGILEPNSRIEVYPQGEHDAQVADIVSLAGPGRHVTALETRLRRIAGNYEMSVTATLTLYTVVNDVPDAIFWSGQTTGVFPRTGSSSNRLPLMFNPGIDVPDTFAISVAIDSFDHDNQGFGPEISGAVPAVGTSPNFVLLQDSFTLQWYQEEPNVFNLQTRIWTVPGPGAAVLIGLGGAAMLRRRRGQ